MRHQNVRNADEVEAREMIKGRHNMRLRQLGKPAGSRALGATLTEVAPGAVSFPRHAVNSLRIGAGNFLRPCRELNQATREISALIRETAMTAKRLTGSGTRR